MSINKIEYTVTKTDIIPKTEQCGGQQGDDGITNIIFTVDSELFSAINEIEGDTLYRVQTIDGAGVLHTSMPLEISNDRKIVYPLKREITIRGGTAFAHLVIYKNDNGNEREMYSFAARIRFRDTAGIGDERQFSERLSEMLSDVDKYIGDKIDEKSSATPTAGNIALYGEGGTLKAGTPKADNDSVPLSKLNEELEKKVDKVEGQGLSTNDYTDEEKTKLKGIEAGAQKNIPADQIYNPESENAQSGKAVAEALENINVEIPNVANAIKITQSGQVLTINDVSPIEHNLDVELASDTITNFTGVKVTRYELDNEGNSISSQTEEADENGIVIGLTSVPKMKIVTDTSNMGGGTDVSGGENLIPTEPLKIFQETMCTNHHNGTYSIDGTIFDEYSDVSALIMLIQNDTTKYEAGTYTLDLDTPSNDVFLNLSGHYTDGTPFNYITNSTGVKTFDATSPFTIETLVVLVNTNVEIILSIAPMFYRSETDNSITINVTYNADTTKVIGNIETTLNDKQDSLVSGESVKTINGESILGSGNIVIEGGSDGSTSSQPEFALLNHPSSYPEWDTNAKTLTIKASSRLLTATKKYTAGMTSQVVLNLETERGMVCYNTTDGTFSVYSHNPADGSIPETSLLIATYSGYGAIVNMASAYKINGDLYGMNASGVRSSAYILLAAQSGTVLCFDTTKKQLKIYANNVIGGEKNTTTPTTTITTLNIYENGIIVFDYDTQTFVNRVYSSKLTDNQILIATYTGYGARAVSTACSYTVDGYPYGINTDNITAPAKITSPDYERIALPDGTPMWSDLITIGDNIIAFVQSTDENHTAKDGKVLVYDTNFNLQKTLYHDFGHCNTCHYNANIDALLIGNLPILENDPTGIPPALYIFYNVSDWLELAEGTVLEFNALNPTIVNLIGLETAYPTATAIAQIAACWGDNNAGENNIVWVSSQFNNWWFKIVLGKGTNQYTYGTYTEQSDSEKFNGTFNALEMYTHNKKYQYTEVTQGMDFYEGRPITAEGHNGARVLKWNFNTVNPYAYGKELDWKPFDYVNSATVDVQYNYIYNPDGTILKVATEGIVIKDGYMYIGVFFYDEGNGAKPANSIFENSVFKYKIS